MTTYDVIVAGAGPGGATAAELLARQGMRVLLLERARMPRPKPCGGGLSPKAQALLDFPLGDLVLERATRVRLSERAGPGTYLDAGGYTIWMVRRPPFDRLLAERARAAGAVLREGEGLQTLALAGEGVEVETTRGRYRARYLVGADGAESRVARALGLRQRRRDAVAIEGEVPTRALTGDAAWIDFSVPLGYAWAFPKGDHWNVGVATADAAAARNLRDHLAAFLRYAGVREPAAHLQGHRIPIWAGAQPLHRGPALLVGDAAGLADPLFGEGIAFALASGRLAAETIAAALAGGTPDLASYSLAVQRTLGRDHRRLGRIARIVYAQVGASIWVLRHSRLARRLAAEVIAGQALPSGLWRRERWSPPARPAPSAAARA